MTPEEEDDLLDRLPASLRHKVLNHLAPGDIDVDSEKLELVELKPHYGIKLLLSFGLGVAALVLAVMLTVATIGMLFPIALVIMVFSIIPFARLLIHGAEVLKSRTMGGGTDEPTSTV